MSSRSFDLLNLIIYDLKRSVALRWLLMSGAIFILGWSCWLCFHYQSLCLLVADIKIFCPAGNIWISKYSILIIFWSADLDIKIFWSAGETKRRGSNCGRHQGDCFYGEHFHFLSLFHSFSSWLNHSLSMVIVFELLWWWHQYPLENPSIHPYMVNIFNYDIRL